MVHWFPNQKFFTFIVRSRLPDTILMLAPDQVKGQSYTFLSEISMFYRFVIVYDIDQDLT